MDCREEGRVLTVQLTGEIDHHAAKALMRELNAELARRFPQEVVLDFSGVTFMDSSGIAVVLRTWRRMQETGGTLRVTHVPEQAARVLRAAGVGKLVPVSTRAEEECT